MADDFVNMAVDEANNLGNQIINTGNGIKGVGDKAAGDNISAGMFGILGGAITSVLNPPFHLVGSTVSSAGQLVINGGQLFKDAAQHASGQDEHSAANLKK